MTRWLVDPREDLGAGRMNQIKKFHPLKSLRPAKEKVPGKCQKRKFKKRRQRRVAVAVMSYLMYHFKRCRDWEVKNRNQCKTRPRLNYQPQDPIEP